MLTSAVESKGLPGPRPVAPWWHTTVLIGLFLALTVGGAFFQQTARVHPASLQQHPQVLPLYASLIVMEWGLFVFVWKGLRRSSTTLAEVIGGRWRRARDVAVDLAIALGLWTAWKIIELGWDRWFGIAHAASIETLLPQTWMEIVLWIGVSVSAGICEELAFRGYFQRQFAALTHTPWIALLLQGMLFGIAHGYQGLAECAKIAVFGVLYGLVALSRKSLRPGMIGHAASDILSGLFGI